MRNLAELERRVRELVENRNRKVDAARRLIDQTQKLIADTNREFDEQMVPLQREIEKLRPKPKPSLSRPIEPDPDWSDEDAEHYRRLLEQ